MDRLPVIKERLQTIAIPVEAEEDGLRWKLTDLGDLSFKDAYQFFKSPSSAVSWSKHNWSKVIPPSKSLLVWGIIQNKIATDDNLRIRGCIVTSMYSLCNCCCENVLHLFCSCNFASQVWSWLGSKLNLQIDISTTLSIISVCDRKWSPQVYDVITAAMFIVFGEFGTAEISPGLKTARLS